MLHEDADMDAQLARTLIGTLVGSADLGESLATAQRVDPGHYDQWYAEWPPRRHGPKQPPDEPPNAAMRRWPAPATCGRPSTAGSRTSSFVGTWATNGCRRPTVLSGISSAGPSGTSSGRSSRCRSRSLRCI